MAFIDPLSSASGSLAAFGGVGARASASLDRLNETAALINGYTDTDNPDALILSMVGGNGLVGCLTELVTGLATAESIGISDSSLSGYVLDLLMSPVNEMKGLLNALFVPGATGTANDDWDIFNKANLKEIGQSFLNPFTAIWEGQFNVLSTSADEFLRGVLWDPSTEETGNRSLVQQTWDRLKLLVTQPIFAGQKIAEGIGGMLLFAITEGIPAIEAEIIYIKKMRGSMRKLLSQACKLPPSMMPGLPNAIITEHLCRAIKELTVVRDDLASSNVLDVDHVNTAAKEVCLAKESIYDPSKGLDGNLAMQFKNMFGLSDVQFNTLRDFGSGKLGALMPDPRFRLQSIMVQRYNAMIQATDPQLLTFHENMKELNNVLAGFGNLYLGDVFARIVELLRKQLVMLKANLEADAAGFSVQSDLLSVDELRPFGASRDQWQYANDWGSGTGSAGLPAKKPTTADVKAGRDDTSKQAFYTAKGPYAATDASTDEAFNRARNWQAADAKNPDYNANGTPRVTEQTGHLQVQTDVQSQGSDIYSYVSTQANAYVMLLSLCSLMEQMQKLYKGVNNILNGTDRVMQAIKKFVYAYGVNVCGDPYGAEDINTNVVNFMKVCEERLNGRTRTNLPVQRAYQGVQQALDKHEKFLLCMRREINNFLKYLGLSTQLIAALMNIIALARSVADLVKAMMSLDLLGLFKFRWTLSRTNILDVLLKALQCLVLQCNNPFMSSLARLAMSRFNDTRNKEVSKAVTMAMMDEGPRIAQKMGNNNRLAAFMRLIQDLQRLTSMDINALCAIKPKVQNNAEALAQNNRNLAAAGTPAEVNVDTREGQKVVETLKRVEAGQHAVVFTATSP